MVKSTVKLHPLWRQIHWNGGLGLGMADPQRIELSTWTGGEKWHAMTERSRSAVWQVLKLWSGGWMIYRSASTRQCLLLDRQHGGQTQWGWEVWAQDLVEMRGCRLCQVLENTRQMGKCRRWTAMVSRCHQHWSYTIHTGCDNKEQSGFDAGQRCSPIHVNERWARSWSLCRGSQPPAVGCDYLSSRPYNTLSLPYECVIFTYLLNRCCKQCYDKCPDTLTSSSCQFLHCKFSLSLICAWNLNSATFKLRIVDGESPFPFLPFLFLYTSPSLLPLSPLKAGPLKSS